MKKIYRSRSSLISLNLKKKEQKKKKQIDARIRYYKYTLNTLHYSSPY